jgi:hypothetical protein
MPNFGFSRNQRVSLTRLENIYCNPFVVESLDYNYTILHGLEKLDFDFLNKVNRSGDFNCSDFNVDDFSLIECLGDFNCSDFNVDDFSLIECLDDFSCADFSPDDFSLVC